MRPRTVMLTLELRNCMVPLSVLRKSHWVQSVSASPDYDWNHVVAQATATVAQPSTPAVRVRVQQAAKRKGSRVKP